MTPRVPVLLASLVVAAACAPAMPTPEPAPTLPASVEVDARWTAPIVWRPIRPALEPLELSDGMIPRPGVLLFSDDMALDVSFRVRAWDTLSPSDWCAVTTAGDQIVLPWLMGCVDQLRLIVPDRIECLGSPVRPIADALAAALLAHPALGAIDLGPVEESPILPPALFEAPARGRIVVIPGTERRFDADTANPDHCLLPLENGAIELRGDSDAFLVLLDVGDRLAILRIATGGIDGVTGKASRDRGYASDVDGGDAEVYLALLGGIGGVSFAEGLPLP